MRVVELFATPIFLFDMAQKPEKNELKNIAIEYKKKNKETKKNQGSRGSFKSDFMDNKDLVTKFYDSISREITYVKNQMGLLDYEPEMSCPWFNVSLKNQFHERHNHPSSDYNGIYFIDVPEQKDEPLKLIFENPDYISSFKKKEPQMYSKYNSTITTIPLKSDMLVVLESHIMTATMQNKSKSPVISLNFDMNFHLSEENA